MSDAKAELRPGELAGRWYPATAAACDRFLEEIELSDRAQLPAHRVAAIVPHAGWVYSGAVAYRAMEAVRASHPAPSLAIIFGGHLGARDRPRIMIEGAWDTPYGPLPVASGLAEDLGMALESELETPDEFYDDNAIEVLMPLVKKLWPAAQVLTIGVPPTADAARIGVEAAQLARARGFRDIVLVGSTDLTHYGPNYNYQPHGRGHAGLQWVKKENDPAVIAHLESMDPAKVIWVAQRSHNACCPGAAAACIAAARKLGAVRGVTTEYTTSWDVRPGGEEPTSFVGYVGVVLGHD